MVSRNGQAETVFRSVPDMPELPRRVFSRAESLKEPAITRWHDHPWIQLSYAIRGVMEVRTMGGRYLAPPHRAILIPAGLQHCVSSEAETEIRSLYIRSEEFPALAGTCQVLEIQPLAHELIRSFSTYAVDYDENGEEGRLVSVLIDQLLAAPNTNLHLPWPADDRLQTICRELNEHPDLPMALSDVAARMGVSEKTVTRLFKKETSLSFRSWRQRLRLLSSLPMLEKRERVTDIALACGYDSTSAFIYAFRSHFGVTPGTFLPAEER
ncbi:AraC family transcriptional regulator [Marinobacter salinexigens]|nr:helix-turn-helix transcriptional regulator [Marinobacter salinexigens]